MAETLRILHYINQFYGGIGGEDKASVGLSTKDGPVGPGMLMKAVPATTTSPSIRPRSSRRYST